MNAVEFIETALINPETNLPFVLTDAERRFLELAFLEDEDGRLLYPELLFSGPKKSGKTGLAGMVTLYAVVVLGGRFGEGYAVANDYEQASSRVFTAIRRIVEASPLLRRDTVNITAKSIEFTRGATIQPVASDHASAAGANPNIATFDELCGYTSERSRRLWDEFSPPPTRRHACRLTVTYAGYEGESTLLEELYKRGLKGEQVGPELYAQPGMLCFWTHQFTAPWQTDAWREQMRSTMRPNAYLRLIENRWVTTESEFLPIEWFDACVHEHLRPVALDPDLPVWLGVDASLKRDSTAIIAVTWDRAEKRARLVAHRVFQPSPDEPLDFEDTIEATLQDFCARFSVRAAYYDPWQMQAVAQRLSRGGLRMIEYPQSVPNLTASSSNLYELIKGRNLALYPDEDIRIAIQRCVAIEASRGWRITKEKTSHKIDVIIALALACHGAVQGGQMAMLEGNLMDLAGVWGLRSAGGPYGEPAGGRQPDWPPGGPGTPGDPVQAGGLGWASGG
jgi:phage terminase large subunit-like protein